MKTILYSLLFLLISVQTSYAQQTSLNSLYNINRYHINSAYAGFNETIEAYAEHRAQWVGMQSAPATTFISVQSRVMKNMGLGGIIMHDKTDLSSTFTGVVSYAYRIKLGKEHNLRLGLSVGIYQSSLSPRDAIVDDELDEVYVKGNRSQISFKNDFSLYYNFKRLEFGLSIPQIFETSKWNKLTETKANVELDRHMVAYLSYAIPLGQRWEIEPSLLYRSLAVTNNQFDINAQVTYNNFISLGVGYRTNAGLLARFGIQIKDMLQIGYAYEFAGAQLHSITSGTHEILIGIKLRKKSKIVVPEPVKAAPIVEKAPEPIEKAPVIEEPIKEEPIKEVIVEKPQPEKIDLETFAFEVEFPLGGTEINESFTNSLNKIVEAMEKHPEVKLEITGYSDDIGSEAVKQRVSKQRADGVTSYLVNHGIDASRISSSGKSDKNPLVPNNSEENRRKNRRVEFKVIQ